MRGYLTFSCNYTVAMTLLALLCAPARSEPSLPTLTGRILDAIQSPVPGARILVLQGARGVAPAQLSDESGLFSLPLAPGRYTLSIVKDGFAPFSLTVDLPAAGLSLPEIVLQVNPVHSAVVVTESSGYLTPETSTATKTLTPLRDVPQSITVVGQEQIRDQVLLSIGDVARYVPGLMAIQGENNRDQLVIRGNSTSADFFLNGVRDDVQYYRDLYNVDRVEVLKGSNAMEFGRGGGGGVVNRVSKEAGFAPLREFSVLGGSFGEKRFAADLDQPLSSRLALRLNAVYENADSFRDYGGLERYAVNPTLTFAPSSATRFTLGFENLNDNRIADRGIPSFQGRPTDLPVSAYFGNPNQSKVFANVNIGTITFDQKIGLLNIRNRTQIADYDRGYQNFVPGAVTADGLQDSVSAYNNATHRRNFFSQTDLVYTASTGSFRHTILGGVEIGRQLTDNLRNTGYFNNSSATSILVPLANGAFFTPANFQHAPTDAFNHLRTNIGAVYVQDQIALNRFVQVIAGLRFDYFDLRFLDKNTAGTMRRIDHLASPRAGLVFKPVTALSLYTSYSVSYLPSSGDQFSSLTSITQLLKPEKFANYEAGVKWDLQPNLALTTAVYRLDRTNTRSIDPNDPTRIVQTGSTAHQGIRNQLDRKPGAPVEPRCRLWLSGRLCGERHRRRPPRRAGCPGSPPHLLHLEPLSASSARRCRSRRPQPLPDVCSHR